MTRLLYLALAGLCSAGIAAEAPVIERAITDAVPLIVPAAKALIVPLTAFDADGDAVSFTVTSSNPKVFARVKSGNPLLQMELQHGGPAPWNGTVVFQLFRDMTPETAGFIAGFAQAGFYDGLTFHRLLDLDANPGAPAWIYQGGQSSNGPGFEFENELRPQLIFSGRGQLAMANSDPNAFGDFRGTNSSQFFITDGILTLGPDKQYIRDTAAETAIGDGLPKYVDARTRHLDFKHTIFGQLTHGWERLADFRSKTATDANGKPTDPVTIVSAKVVTRYQPDPANAKTYSDAVLILTSSGAGPATITVRPVDSTGKAGAPVVFDVTAMRDTDNTRPFIASLPPLSAPAGRGARLPLQVVDLEHDYLTFRLEIAKSLFGATPPGRYDARPAVQAFFGTNDSYEGPVRPVARVTQYDQTYRGDIDGLARGVHFYNQLSQFAFVGDSWATTTVAIGDQLVVPEPLTLEVAHAGGTGSVSSQVVGRFTDTDPLGSSTDMTAVVNWGDGTTPSGNGVVIARDSSRPGVTAYQVAGSHNYARPGTYTVVTKIYSNDGAGVAVTNRGVLAVIRSTAVVSGGALRAVGQTVESASATLTDRLLATFTDSETAPPAGYAAFIDWGDGLITAGRVAAAGPGRFSVLGTKRYVDAGTFSATVRIRKLATGAEVTAWSTILLTGFTGPKVLPPFSTGHLVAGLSDIVPVVNGISRAPKPTKVTAGSQTFLTYDLTIINSGNKAVTNGFVRFYLSADKKLDLNASGTPINGDRRVLVGTFPELAGLSLAAGKGLSYPLDITAERGDMRLRLPSGENGTGLNLLVALVYSDPIASVLPISREHIIGPVNGISLNGRYDFVFTETSETGTKVTVAVRLDKMPAQNVAITFEISQQGIPEGTITAPAAVSGKHTLTFTPANWNVAQNVEIQGKADGVADGNKQYLVEVLPAVSTDRRFNGMDAPDIVVTNRNN